MSENSSNSSKRDCNTKQISPSKHWCFTLNNYTNKDLLVLKNINSSIIVRYIFQSEIGEDKGTPHLQGYLEFKSKKRPMSVFKSTSWGSRPHWEKTRHIDKAIEYCKKNDTFSGDIRESRKISLPYTIDIKFYDWQKKLFDILKKPPDDRSIYWIWEDKGNRGKTVFQKYVFLNLESVVVLSGSAHDMKNGIVQYESRTGCLPKIVLINIPRSKLEYVSYTGIEEIKDMFFFSGKYEGGMVCGPSPHIFIFANDTPERHKLSKDRWKIIRI